ncbi:hypothetical protein STXM2123_1024 [Streptomyces sp. F-3]|nr:hypothetical protein STXM2123_1024 [Streptomyces sp. F-3]
MCDASFTACETRQDRPIHAAKPVEDSLLYRSLWISVCTVSRT